MKKRLVRYVKRVALVVVAVIVCPLVGALAGLLYGVAEAINLTSE